MPSLARATRQALIGLFAASALVILLVVTFAGRSTTTEAHAGQYAHFPGPDTGWIDIPTDPALTPSAITIETWVFLTTYVPWGPDSAGDCPTLVGKAYKTSYWLGLCSGKIRFYPKGGTNMYWDGTGVVPLNHWTHVAVTYDGTTTNTYINGVLDSTTASVNGAIGSNTTDLGIGSDADWFASPKGALDEVRLWNVARSGSDIAATMNTTITTPQAGLAGVWNMEGDAADAVGGHNGTTHNNIEFSATPLESETPTPSPTPSPSPAPGAFHKGDANCDGMTNAADAVPYLKYAGGLAGQPQPCSGASPIALPQGGVFGQWFNAAPATGYIEVPDDPTLNPTSAITIEVRVNPYTYANVSGSTCVSLVGKGFTTAYWLGLCAGHVRFYSRGTASRKDSVATIPLRQWTNVAVVADATTLTFYINGAVDNKYTDLTGPLTTDSRPLRIGSDPDYSARPWAAIDEVRIWNIARSEAEIMAAMNTPIVPLPGLVAAYHLDGDANDATGAHNGAAVGTIDLGNDLPAVQWLDINCDGLVDVPDALALLIDAAGITPSLAAGCEPIGTAES
jgi:hypothetical protein